MKRWRRTNRGLYRGEPVTILEWELFAPATPDTWIQHVDGRTEWVDAGEIEDEPQEVHP